LRSDSFFCVRLRSFAFAIFWMVGLGFESNKVTECLFIRIVNVDFARKIRILPFLGSDFQRIFEDFLPSW